MTAAPSDIPGLRHERITGAGIGLHAVAAGEGPLVVLLHGFPEYWYSWRHQIAALARAGFSVLAPDMRGFNLSDKPRQRDAYRLSRLADDVRAIVRERGHQTAHVAGHDWGGMVAWHAAAAYPDVVSKLVILNAPHPALFRRALTGPGQMFKSAYVPFFLMPKVPEYVLSRFGYLGVRLMLRTAAARSGVFSKKDLASFVEAIGQPGALTSGLNYYRANARGGNEPPVGRIQAPTLVIWGERDPALGIALLDGLDRLVPELRLERLPDVGHWVQNEAPEDVSRLMVSFLRD